MCTNHRFPDWSIHRNVTIIVQEAHSCLHMVIKGTMDKGHIREKLIGHARQASLKDSVEPVGGRNRSSSTIDLSTVRASPLFPESQASSFQISFPLLYQLANKLPSTRLPCQYFRKLRGKLLSPELGCPNPISFTPPKACYVMLEIFNLRALHFQRYLGVNNLSCHLAHLNLVQSRYSYISFTGY